MDLKKWSKYVADLTTWCSDCVCLTIKVISLECITGVDLQCTTRWWLGACKFKFPQTVEMHKISVTVIFVANLLFTQLINS